MVKWQLIKPEVKKKSLGARSKAGLDRMGFVTAKVVHGIFYVLRSSKELYKMQIVLAESEPYIISGTAIDQDWLYKNRGELEQRIVDEMRKEGYIPVLDMSPGLKELNYDEENENFSYVIEMQAYKVGVHRSHNYMGVLVAQGLVVGADAETFSIAEL